ncbi:M48 family metallopeptidase [Tsukamurella sp. 8F]|uniref:M48 family metallopeptidase n=1 Tax=unclassified Tsukamurella TaxID=2633480 RepID=UPI0023B9C0AE|nr:MULTISPECIES: M48 family metallopeptidase [unclassified Tsukamurella]MDF0528929.1 M48 family metallopeptidase [Tsukamurella sp. 8J]MDF0589468.1 M48 family metallopeptidase [Tsukamurella sp. 8F]
MTDLPARMFVEFPEISTRAWEHPSDRAALTTLRSLKGFDTILKTLSALLRERQHRLLYLGSAIRVDERQFPTLHGLRADCVRTLDSPTVPEMFVAQDPQPNAFTIGMDTPFIVLTSGLLDLLNVEELRFVVGHELGHAMSGHAVYRTMLMHLMRLAASFGWMPIGGWALRAVVAALLEWQRKSELSGDRAGLLCVQDPDVALRSHMKMAGGTRLDEMDTQRFLAQAADYERTGDLRDGVLKLLNLELQTHPFAVLRAADLNRWVERGAYGAILGGTYPRRGDDAGADIGDDVRDAARSYRTDFDASGDPLVSTLRDMGNAVGSVAGAAADGVTDLGRRFGQWARGGGSGGRGDSGSRDSGTGDSGSADHDGDEPA